MKKIGFGSKYEFKPDSNPPLGTYDAEAADRLTKPKVRAASIAKERKTRVRPPEVLPDPGQYSMDVIEFGKDAKPIRMGVKYEEKIDPSLGPGTYAPEPSILKILPRSPSVRFDRPTGTKFVKAPEYSPEADDKHI